MDVIEKYKGISGRVSHPVLLAIRGCRRVILRIENLSKFIDFAV